MAFCVSSWKSVLVWTFVVSGFVAAAGIGGASLYFDGANDYAIVFPGFDLLSSWTIEAWIKAENPVAPGRCILGLHSFAGNNALTVTSTDRGAWSIEFGPERHRIPHSVWNENTDGRFDANAHHFALVHEAISDAQSKITFFLNGTSRAAYFISTSSTRAELSPMLPMLLGSCHAVDRVEGGGRGTALLRERFFHGHMDEVRWWGKALPPDQVAVSWLWSGSPTAWPKEDFEDVQGVAAAMARTSALRAQYSMDEVREWIADGTSAGRDGSLGTEGGKADHPKYMPSPFTQLKYGTIYERLRANHLHTVAFKSLYKAEGGPYGGFEVVQLSGNLQWYDFQTDAILAVGSLGNGLGVKVQTGPSTLYESIQLRPCRRTDAAGQLQLADCVDQRLITVAFTIEQSRAPVAGMAYALQLLPRGAFVKLPSLPRTCTIEFHLKLTLPLVSGSTLLSVSEKKIVDGSVGRELIRLWIQPATGGVLDVCVLGEQAPKSIHVPGIVTTDAQHLAISFKREANMLKVGSWRYSVSIAKDGNIIKSADFDQPCSSLDSPVLLAPTLGQRYVADEAGAAGAAEPWSQSFAAMYVSEIRIWEHVRTPQQLRDGMQTRMAGTANGLWACAPITEADALAASPGARKLKLTNIAPILAKHVPFRTFEVACSLDYEACSDFVLGEGFFLRPSPFGLPPEIGYFEIETQVTGEIPLLAFDIDNYEDHEQDSTNKDTFHFEVVEFPNPKCGWIYGQGDMFHLNSEGRTRPESIEESRLPLRFVPFGGATFAEQEAMQETCRTALQYHAVDDLGMRSVAPATIEIQVWRRAVFFLSANASNLDTALSIAATFSLQRLAAAQMEGSLMMSGGILRVDFDRPTNEPDVNAKDLFDLVDGSWGEASPELYWANDGATSLIVLSTNASSQGAELVPGRTRLKVRYSAGLRAKGDDKSAPCHAISEPLVGDFQKRTCNDGFLLDFGDAECHPCPPGTSWNISFDKMPTCSICSPGKYALEQASLECTACPAGKYMPEDNKNRSSCLKAPMGRFVPDEGSTYSFKCMFNTSAETEGSVACGVCPFHADCAASGKIGTEAVAIPGHFKTSANSFVPCRVPSACPGDNVCFEDTMNATMGCYPCAPGYSRGSGSIRDAADCKKCPGKFTSLLQVAWSFAITLFMVFMYTILNIVSARRSACLQIFLLKISFGHMLMMSACTSLEEWQLRMAFGEQAPFLRAVLKIILPWDGRFPGGLLHMECVHYHYRELSSHLLLGKRLDEMRLDELDELRLWVTLFAWVSVPFLVALTALLLSMFMVWVWRSGRLVCSWCGVEYTEGPESWRKIGENVIPGNAVVPVWIPDPGESSPSTKNQMDDMSALPYGWEAVWCHEHNQYYYHHRADCTSTWVRPVFVPSPLNSPMAGANNNSDPIGDFVQQTLEFRLLGIWRVRTFGTLQDNAKEFLVDSSGLLIATAELTYAPVLRQLMTFIRCDSLTGDPDEMRLLVAPEFVCGQSVQVKIASFAWLGLGVWGLGVPGLCCYLCEARRCTMGDFTSRVSIGLLASAYERQYIFWESLRFLCHFALTATIFAPSVHPQLRLVVLLAVGNAFSFMHHACEPFDNVSGVLLDTLESQALRIFCAFVAVMLLSFSNVVNSTVCTVLVLAVLSAHVLFMLVLVLHILRHMRRSLADAAVTAHMKGHKASAMAKYFFDKETQAREKMALISYDDDKNLLSIVSGPNTNRRRKIENQMYVACGIADCLAYAIADCKVCRLSTYFMEFVGREAFAVQAERLQRERDVRQRMRPKIRKSQQKQLSQSRSLDPEAFVNGMLAGDFQGAINEGCLSVPREELEQVFSEFMVAKNMGDLSHYELNPCERMLKLFNLSRFIAPLANKEEDKKSEDEELFNLRSIEEPSHIAELPAKFGGKTMADVRRSEDNARRAEIRTSGKTRITSVGPLSNQVTPNLRHTVPPAPTNMPEAPPRPREFQTSYQASTSHVTQRVPPPTQNLNCTSEAESRASSSQQEQKATVEEVEVALSASEPERDVGNEMYEGTGMSDNEPNKQEIDAIEPGDPQDELVEEEEVLLVDESNLLEAELLGNVLLAPWGVLGSQLGLDGIERTTGHAPDNDVVVVDPAGLFCLQKGGPNAATGCSVAIYKWCGVDEQGQFPEQVVSAIEEDLQAKFQSYGNRHVIHVAAPDFRDNLYEGQADEAVEALAIAYQNVFGEWVKSRKPKLRIPPISGGNFSGEYDGLMPEFTAKALRHALDEWRAQGRRRFNTSNVELCIFLEGMLDDYRTAISEEFG